MNYRKHRKGDTIRVTGDRGQHLFNIDYGNIELNNGVELGVECVLVRGEDNEGTVRIPRGILADEQTYLDARCIELVQAVEDKTTAAEDKPSVVKHSDDGRDCQLFSVQDPAAHRLVAQIWYDTDRLPKEVAKSFAEAIKAVYDSIVTKRKTNNSKKIMEDKTTNDEFESKFGYFEQRFSTMHDPHPDEIRDFITIIILAAEHDSSLVDASFKWLASRNKQN